MTEFSQDETAAVGEDGYIYMFKMVAISVVAAWVVTILCQVVFAYTVSKRVSDALDAAISEGLAENYDQVYAGFSDNVTVAVDTHRRSEEWNKGHEVLADRSDKVVHDWIGSDSEAYQSNTARYGGWNLNIAVGDVAKYLQTSCLLDSQKFEVLHLNKYSVLEPTKQTEQCLVHNAEGSPAQWYLHSLSLQYVDGMNSSSGEFSCTGSVILGYPIRFAGIRLFDMELPITIKKTFRARNY